jgi:MoaA/NifB/PqqE/SkfB family radical SAM enzyme
MTTQHPERLNLAIARRCHVSCPGCYTYFGKEEPDLPLFVSAVRAFVWLGIDKVTVSGGDPLTIKGLPDFLRSLTDAGVQSVKVDTVGVGIRSGETLDEWALGELLATVDFLGIPLDGWSNRSAAIFRAGRPDLHGETVELLNALDRSAGAPRVVINTVAHQGNIEHLAEIGSEVMRHACVCHWNIFQYTATDQAAAGANSRYGVDDRRFEQAKQQFLSGHMPVLTGRASGPIEFRSGRSRLGQYLLINSDGEAWLPDSAGNTIRLGPVIGREAELLAHWARVVADLRAASRADGSAKMAAM